MKKYTVSMTYEFSAARNIPGHDSVLSNLHGEHWQIIVELGSNILLDGKDRGMVANYREVDDLVKSAIKILDYRILNNTPGLENPTTENIAKWIFDRLEPSLHFVLQAITASEAGGISCRYARE